VLGSFRIDHLESTDLLLELNQAEVQCTSAQKQTDVPTFMFTSGLQAYVSIYFLEPTSVWTGVAVRAHFELMEKLGVDKWCFHDRDIAPEGKTLKVCFSLC
jgi:hypothetical protein